MMQCGTRYYASLPFHREPDQYRAYFINDHAYGSHQTSHFSYFFHISRDKLLVFNKKKAQNFLFRYSPLRASDNKICIFLVESTLQ